MRTILLALVAALAACSGSTDPGPPPDVAGNYDLTVTDGQNGCNLENFETNSMQSGITVAIAQDGANLSATPMAMQGLVLAFGAGDTVSGTIAGHEASLTSSSDRTQGGCAYTTTATVNIQFSNDQVTGTFLYTDSGNGSSDCGLLQQCTSTQTFTGSR